MRLHRLPPVLVLHIKRFKYKGTSREKLSTNVTFPLRDLQLAQCLSDEAQGTAAPSSQSYDLFAVSHHFGNMVGGHYTATCMVPPLERRAADAKAEEGQPRGPQWWTFNDDQVSRIAPQSVVSNTAYMLFYVRRDCGADAAGLAAAAVEGSAPPGVL